MVVFFPATSLFALVPLAAFGLVIRDSLAHRMLAGA
jgi:hypothetical protein